MHPLSLQKKNKIKNCTKNACKERTISITPVEQTLSLRKELPVAKKHNARFPFKKEKEAPTLHSKRKRKHPLCVQ